MTRAFWLRRPLHAWPWPLYLLVALILGALLNPHWYLVQDSLFNSYRFNSPDSFDWIMQGEYVRQLLLGAQLPELKYLRDPVFVLINTLDAMLGGAGLVTLTATNAGAALCVLSTVALGRLLGLGWPTSLGFGLLTILSPVAYVFNFVWADCVAVGLMSLCVLYCCRYLATSRWGDFVTASALALVGGSTQKYAVMPYLVCLGYAVVPWRRVPWLRCRVAELLVQRGRVLATGALTLVIMAALHALWRVAIAHETTPSQFSELQLSTANSEFYLNVWSAALVAFVPVLLALGILGGRSATSESVDGSRLAAAVVELTGPTVLGFMALTYNYWWHDSRLSISWVVLFPMLCAGLYRLVLARAANASPWLPAGLAATVVLALGVTLYTPWRPEIFWRGVSRLSTASTRESWVYLRVAQGPRDRLGLASGWEEYCRSGKVPDHPRSYQRYTFRFYANLMCGSLAEPPPPTESSP